GFVTAPTALYLHRTLFACDPTDAWRPDIWLNSFNHGHTGPRSELWPKALHSLESMRRSSLQSKCRSRPLLCRSSSSSFRSAHTRADNVSKTLCRSPILCSSLLCSEPSEVNWPGRVARAESPRTRELQGHFGAAAHR